MTMRPWTPGVWATVVAVLFVSVPAVSAPSLPRRRMERLQRAIADLEQRVQDARRIAGSEPKVDADELADRLVRGQLLLTEGDFERAALTFFELRENHADSEVGIQALYYLGVALAKLGLERWAVECFSDNLRAKSPQATRFHQRSLARLLDIAAPRGEAGLARRPGMSATPEHRSRLEALGVPVRETPQTRALNGEDIRRIMRWIDAVDPAQREPDLRYAHGRMLFLQAAYAQSREALAPLIPEELSLERDDASGKFSFRAAYLWAAASMELGEQSDAIRGFERLTAFDPDDRPTREIVDLAWLAIGRIRHDAGDVERSVAAYRGISRTSVFFPEALYETAWALLRGERYERALESLELLEVYVTESTFRAEIAQLRGKILIARRNWADAEREFRALRERFERRARFVDGLLVANSDAVGYFEAVVGDDLRNFSLDTVVPAKAIDVARSLRRTADAETLARTVGELDRELSELETLMARMEEAVKADERALLFTDLAAQWSALDTVADEVTQLHEMLVKRARRGVWNPKLRNLASRQRNLVRELETQHGAANSRAGVLDRIDELGESVQRYALVIDAMKAELVAVERQYKETAGEQKIDADGFFNQAADMRGAVRSLQAESAKLRDDLSSTRTSLRYTDPWGRARRVKQSEYWRVLDEMWSVLAADGSRGDLVGPWRRLAELREALDPIREQLHARATRRLQKAWVILAQEKSKLVEYRVQLDEQVASTRALVAEVVGATFSDVGDELRHGAMRSEVGLLDIAFAIQAVEVDIMRSLEARRTTDLREIDRLLKDASAGEVGR